MLTVARPAPGHTASKTFHADGTVEPYNAGSIFSFHSYPVETFQGLSALLESVENDPSPAFIVPGVPRSSPVVGRRLAAAKHGQERTLFDVPHSVVCFDFDNIQDMAGVHPFEPFSHRQLIRILGLPTHAWYRVQWSSSTGLGEKVGAHIWCLSNKPLCADQRARIYQRYGSDPSVARPAHPIYVQPPRFDGGARDPFLWDGRICFRSSIVSPHILPANQ